MIGMMGLAAIRTELFKRLSPTFTGPEILDAMDEAEKLILKYGISIDDEQGMERVVSEAVDTVLARLEDEGDERESS